MVSESGTNEEERNGEMWVDEDLEITPNDIHKSATTPNLSDVVLFGPL